MLRTPEISWESMMFAKDPSGDKVTVKIFYTTHPRTHGMFPPEETVIIPARDHIGNLELECHAHNLKVRKTPWYLLVILPLIINEHFQKLSRRMGRALSSMLRSKS